MSLVVLGLSHHTAPLPLLETMSLDAEARTGLAAAVTSGENRSGIEVVSTRALSSADDVDGSVGSPCETCNRCGSLTHTRCRSKGTT